MFTVGFYLPCLVIWYAWFFFLSTRLHENWPGPRWCCLLPARLCFWSGLTVRDELLAIPTVLVQLRSIITVFRVVGARPGALMLVLNQSIKETKKKNTGKQRKGSHSMWWLGENEQTGRDIIHKHTPTLSLGPDMRFMLNQKARRMDN